MATLPADYLDRVYAGVLGKIIGVYLGRPFEQWSREAILKEFGEIWYYVHEKRGLPLVVTDDDISGTFTFLRAIEDYGPEVTAEQCGKGWLNYIIREKAILWWGGVGLSSEHTAFMRLLNGISAPESGSIRLNGQTVAEQIGAQIFIDGWGLINPGDPERAAHYAKIAGSVSHDGVAIDGAQMVAAMIALAFEESSIESLIEGAVKTIRPDSLLRRVLDDVREWHAQGLSWDDGFTRFNEQYGYAKYGGGCHIVPNHGLILHALIHGAGDFQKSLMVVNTCGLDTDCNSGNVGCILGVLNGLDALNAGPDWRGPVADRMYLPTADGGGCITDAATWAIRIANIGRSLRGEKPIRPKGGARYSFALLGSVHGFQPSLKVDSKGTVLLSNRQGSLNLSISGLSRGRVARAVCETFPGAEARAMGGYAVLASPTLYPGQVVQIKFAGATGLKSARVRPVVGIGDANDHVQYLAGPEIPILGAETANIEWTIPETNRQPILEFGLEVLADVPSSGTLAVDTIHWCGAPTCELGPAPGTLWRKAWVEGCDAFSPWSGNFDVTQNSGTGLLITGSTDWVDYEVTSQVHPALCDRNGIAVRVGGMRRYYALLLSRAGSLDLVRSFDSEDTVASSPFDWSFDSSYALRLRVEGNRVEGSVEGGPSVAFVDQNPLKGGGVALLVTDGRTRAKTVRIEAI